jgi:sulfur-oxidizing protein SoxY
VNVSQARRSRLWKHVSGGTAAGRVGRAGELELRKFNRNAASQSLLPDPGSKAAKSGSNDAVGSGEAQMIMVLNRRQVLATSIGAVAATWAGGIVPAAANNANDLISKFTGGKPVADGKVKLDLPEIAENGNTVPMTVSVESPMTESSHVSEVLVVADGNPNGGVVTFHFTPLSGVAEANTRIRLAKTQTVTAIAKMSDGSFHKASKAVKVTIGGCGG